MVVVTRDSTSDTGEMTDRDIAEAGTILRVLAGSTVHGTSLPGDSDRDEMGIAITPKTHVLGLRIFATGG